MKIKSFNTFYFVIVLCGLLSFAVAFAYYLQFHQEPISHNTSDWSNLGSYIGGIIGSIFSLTSVILIYMTFRSQQQTTNLQMFETTFFNMLANQRDLLKYTQGTRSDVIYNGAPAVHNTKLIGHDFIEDFADTIESRLKSFIPALAKEEWQRSIHDMYSISYKRNAATLGHYFRHLYHIIKYTHESSVQDKKKYIDLIQAQMSDNELYINFYNAISNYGNKKSLPLLDQYGFFENIQSRGSLFDAHAKQFYPKTKFKNRTPVEEVAENLVE